MKLHTGKCLKQYKMTENSVQRIMDLTEKFPVTYEAFVDGEAYAPKAYVENPIQFGASVKGCTVYPGDQKAGGRYLGIYPCP